MKPPTDKAIAAMAPQQCFRTLKHVVDEYLERMAMAAVAMAENEPEHSFDDGQDMTVWQLDQALEHLRYLVDWIDEANTERKKRVGRSRTRDALANVAAGMGDPTPGEVDNAKRLLARKTKAETQDPKEVTG